MLTSRETKDTEYEADALWRLRSTFDEVVVYKNSFLIRFPFLEKVVHVDVGSQVLDACATHNFLTVITEEHIYIVRKDQTEIPQRCSYEKGAIPILEFEPASWVSVKSESCSTTIKDRWWTRRKPSSDMFLTSTISTVYLVYTVDGTSTVVRLFNEYTYLESGIVKPSVVQIPEDLRIVAAASGNDHSLFLTDKGAVYALGTGSRGELGNGLIPRVCELTWVEALEGVNVVNIVAAGWHSGALTDDGDVYLWGWNHRGQLGDEKVVLEDHWDPVEYYPSPLEIDIRIVRIELRDHLTALWTAEDGEEPSIVFGSSDIGMPTIRLRYYDQVPANSNPADDRTMEMVFLKRQPKPSHYSYVQDQEISSCLKSSDSFEYPVRERD